MGTWGELTEMLELAEMTDNWSLCIWLPAVLLRVSSS
jgi:hypothetical protein